MKKLLSLLLAAAMILSLSVGVFADGETDAEYEAWKAAYLAANPDAADNESALYELYLIETQDADGELLFMSNPASGTIYDGLIYDYSVIVDGEAVAFSDAAPVNVNDRVLVPFYAVADVLGAGKDWNSETQTATIILKNGDTVTMTIGSTAYQVNGVEQETPLIVAPQLIDDRTYVGVRDLGGLLGLEVRWSEKYNTAILEAGDYWDKLWAGVDDDFSILNDVLAMDAGIDLSGNVLVSVEERVTATVDGESETVEVLAQALRTADGVHFVERYADAGENLMEAYADPNTGTVYAGGSAVSALLAQLGVAEADTEKFVAIPVGEFALSYEASEADAAADTVSGLISGAVGFMEAAGLVDAVDSYFVVDAIIDLFSVLNDSSINAENDEAGFDFDVTYAGDAVTAFELRIPYAGSFGGMELSSFTYGAGISRDGDSDTFYCTESYTMTSEAAAVDFAMTITLSGTDEQLRLPDADRTIGADEVGRIAAEKLLQEYAGMSLEEALGLAEELESIADRLPGAVRAAAEALEAQGVTDEITQALTDALLGTLLEDLPDEVLGLVLDVMFLDPNAIGDMINLASDAADAFTALQNVDWDAVQADLLSTVTLSVMGLTEYLPEETNELIGEISGLVLGLLLRYGGVETGA